MKNLVIATSLVVGIAMLTSATEPKTELGRLAASLKPGEMKELVTKGFTHDLSKSWYSWDHEGGKRVYGAQAMFEIVTGNWSNDAKWDPVTQQVLYLGIGHYAAMKFVTYSAISNEWTLMPVPPWADPRSIDCQVLAILPDNRLKLSAGKTQGMWLDAYINIVREGKIVARVMVSEVNEKDSVAKVLDKSGEIKVGDSARSPDATVCGKDEKTGRRIWPRGHMYDRLAISSEHRLLAVNWFGLHLYDIDRKVWLPSVKTASGGKDAYQVMEYFPERKTFIYECNWGKDLRLWDIEKKEERKLGSYPFGIHGFMEYNPVHKVLIWGGGDNDTNLYRMDASGTITKLKPLPVGVSCCEAHKVICDPVSGEYLIQTSAPGTREPGMLYAFHPLRDEWREIPDVKFPLGIGFGLNTYGVVMLCTYDRTKAAGRVFIYKHKPLWPEDGSGKSKAK